MTSKKILRSQVGLNPVRFNQPAPRGHQKKGDDTFSPKNTLDDIAKRVSNPYAIVAAYSKIPTVIAGASHFEQRFRFACVPMVGVIRDEKLLLRLTRNPALDAAIQKWANSLGGYTSVDAIALEQGDGHMYMTLIAAVSGSQEVNQRQIQRARQVLNTSVSVVYVDRRLDWEKLELRA